MLKRFKIFIVFIIILIIAVACQNSSIKESDNGIVFTDYDCEMVINISTNTDQAYVFESQWKGKMATWQEEIESRYGIKININYVSAYNFSLYMDGSYLIDQIENEGMTDLIALNYYEIANIGKLVEQGLILPLDEYLEDNAAYKNLPDYILKPYYIQGHLYALPSGNSNFPSLRLINKKMLLETGLAVPETLSEYYEMLVGFSKIDDAVPMVMNLYNNNAVPMIHSPQMGWGASNAILNLKDIFFANGCYPSYNGYTSIGYDPLTGAIEDFMLKPDASVTFTYIDNLFESKLLQVKKVNDFDVFSTDKTYGSYYNCMSNYKESYKSDYETIWYLKGSNDKYLNDVEPSKMVYVLSRNSVNPKETVNAYVNAFMLNKEGYQYMYLGCKNDAFTVDENRLVRKEETNLMRLVDVNIDYLTSDNRKYTNEAGIEYFQNMTQFKSLAESLIQDDMFFTTTCYPFADNVMAAGDVFGWFFDYFINGKGSNSIDDIMEEYRIYAKIYGAKEALDQLNELYGTKATYTF
ncbi:MAG: extracellular solute-binding protein [Clostridia bacterium]|nr:extracellular solute-binding protein [Clostridia bacterium]